MDHLGAGGGKTGQLREVASRADAQAALWLLELGDHAAAAEHVRKAVAEGGPATPGATALIALLVQPGYRGLSRNCTACCQGLRAGLWAVIRQELPVSRAGARGNLWAPHLRARRRLGRAAGLWAYEETGHYSRRTAAAAQSAAASAGPGHIRRSISRGCFFCDGALLDKQGQHSQAVRNYRLFVTLCGADGEIWGEEQRARQE